MTDSVRVVLTKNEVLAHRRHVIDGLSLSAVGEEMGVSKQRISQLVKEAKLKMAVAGDRPMSLVTPGVDDLSPEVGYFREAAAGIKMDAALVAAIERRYMGALPTNGDEKALRTLNNASLLELLEDRTRRIFDYLDDYAMAKSTGPQLAKMIESFVNLRQLLKGQPTSIVDVNDRRKMNEIGQALLAEMERRKNVIDVTPEQVETPVADA